MGRRDGGDAPPAATSGTGWHWTGDHESVGAPEESSDSWTAPRTFSYGDTGGTRPGESGGAGDRRRAELAPGVRIGRYEIICPLAHGGMAELYVARAHGIEGFGKLVVLKRILPSIADDPHYVEMFLGEARLAALLDHPNIVATFDLGREGSDYYYVMEYVFGRSLLELLRAAHGRGEALGIGPAIAAVLGAAAGLHHAHTALGLDGEPLGIIHRDVTPANVLVTYEGFAKLIDFGIAKASVQTVQTSAGERKGNVSYMSPEQLTGVRVDHRTDVFSLGVLLFEATTMSRLFRRSSHMDVVERLRAGSVPRPSERVPNYPETLEKIVMACLQPDPALRPSTALKLVDALEIFATREGLRVSPTALGRRMEELFPVEDDLVM